MIRPLRDVERFQLAGDLRDLADELERTTAKQVQQSLGTAQEFGYKTANLEPHRGNVVEDGEHQGPTTAPERFTLKPDPMAQRAMETSRALRFMLTTVRQVLMQMAAWNPDRPVRFCPLCGHPYEGTTSRCTQRDAEGRQCGATETSEARTCGTCGTAQQVGQHLRDGDCNRCRMRSRRRSTRVARVDRLQLGTKSDADL